MSSAFATAARIHVAPVTSADDWRHARRLTAELVDWLIEAVGLDVRAHQHDSNEELDAPTDFYQLPFGRFLLGYVDGVPSGTTGVHLIDSETAELRRVWITPSARGNRLAPLLLQTGIDTARSLGARRVWLETATGHMDKAIDIYTRAGFRPIPHYTALHEALPGVLSLGLDLS